MVLVKIIPEHPTEMETVERLMLDWSLYGEIHMTNAPNGNGFTRLDPTKITYRPEKRKTRSK